jgi:hypothetical protein
MNVTRCTTEYRKVSRDSDAEKVVSSAARLVEALQCRDPRCDCHRRRRDKHTLHCPHFDGHPSLAVTVRGEIVLLPHIADAVIVALRERALWGRWRTYPPGFLPVFDGTTSPPSLTGRWEETRDAETRRGETRRRGDGRRRGRGCHPQPRNVSMYGELAPPYGWAVGGCPSVVLAGDGGATVIPSDNCATVQPSNGI